jgi:hypothetical protein
MNMQQGIEISKAAKAAGYAISVKQGKVRFETVVYKPNGVSIVTPHTDWLSYEEAMEIINDGCKRCES